VSGLGFLLIIVAFFFLYFILVRPQKRRQLAQQQMLDDLRVGDEVVTAGGIYGDVTDVGEEDVRVLIAPELEVRVARRAIAAILTEHDEEPDAADPAFDPMLDSALEPERPDPTPGT
jgi:preprotein translocase subunit YajC